MKKNYNQMPLFLTRGTISMRHGAFNTSYRHDISSRGGDSSIKMTGVLVRNFEKNP